MPTDNGIPARYGRIPVPDRAERTGRNLYWFLMHGALPTLSRTRRDKELRMGFLKGFQVVAESREEALAIVYSDGDVANATVEDWDVIEVEVPEPTGLRPARPGHSVIRESDLE